MALELIAGVVIGHLTAGAGHLVTAPSDALAEHWKERIKERLDRTRKSAEAKSKGSPLTVEDRTAFKALNEAAFNDDELVADYLGGVLAASEAGDDSGTSVVALIGRLSARELRLHYFFYRELRRLWPAEEKVNLYVENECSRAGVEFWADDVAKALGLAGLAGYGAILQPLLSERLLHPHHEYGSKDGGWSTRLRPSARGAELFLWGHGVSPPNANRLFDPECELISLAEVPGAEGAALVSPPKVN